MKNKLTYAILIFLSIITFNFYVFPATNAKFILEEEHAISYSGSFKSLYGGTGVIERVNITELGNVELEFSFERNIEILNDIIAPLTDSYTIETSNCMIAQITPSDKVRGNTITFNDNTQTTVSVRLYCVSDDIKNNDILSENVVIKERISDEVDFTYMDFSYSEPYANYLEDLIQESTTISESDDMYTEFINWINRNAKAALYEHAINTYVESEFLSKDDIIDKNKFTILPGLEITYNEEDNTYTYTLTENFIGYARTFNSTTNNYFYFSTEDANTIDEAFAYYLNRYLPGDENATTRELILTYVNNRGGASSVILNSKNIPGLFYNASGNYIIVRPEIIDYANNQINPLPQNLTFKSKVWMAADTQTAFEIWGMSYTDYQDFIDTVVKSSRKNNNSDYSDANKITFEDYFAIKIDNKLVIIKVSCLDPTQGYNVIEYQELAIPESAQVSINYGEDNSLTSINLTASSEEDILNTQSILNEYFNANSKELSIVGSISHDETTNIYQATYTLDIKTISLNPVPESPSQGQASESSDNQASVEIENDNQTNNEQSTNESNETANSNSENTTNKENHTEEITSEGEIQIDTNNSPEEVPDLSLPNSDNDSTSSVEDFNNVPVQPNLPISNN